MQENLISTLVQRSVVDFHRATLLGNYSDSTQFRSTGPFRTDVITLDFCVTKCRQISK